MLRGHHDPVSRNSYFGKLSDRESKWVLHHLVTYFKIHNMYAGLDHAERMKLINDAASSNENIRNNVSDIIAFAKQAIIEGKQFEWLKEAGDRLCYIAYIYLPQLKQKEFSLWPTTINQHLPSDFFNLIPTSTEERVNSIIRDFDFLHQGDADAKVNSMSVLKSWCIDRNNSLDEHIWLDKNDKAQIKWAWEYLSKRLYIFTNKPLIEIEQYYTLIAYIDTWPNHPAELNDILGKAKRAWSQKKHRQKLNNRKTYNIPLSVESKTQLNQLAEAEDKKIYITLEKIIQEAYNKYLHEQQDRTI